MIFINCDFNFISTQFFFRMDEKAIDAFYKERTVFITGATGFMGKVLMEKLLYGCPSLERMYILIRPKKCTSITARLDAMFKLPVSKKKNFSLFLCILLFFD